MPRIALAPFVCLISLAWHGAAAAESPRVVRSFDADWKFNQSDADGAEKPAFDDGDWRRLDLPHDWSVEEPFSPEHASGTGFLPGGVGWYRKEFTLPESSRGKRLAIRFDGVYRNSDVWVNGVHLGSRPYGYIHFQYDLTPHLKFGDDQTNVIAVRVQRENVADSRWYTGTGIYRHTWLIETEPLAVAPWGVFVTTPRVTDKLADVAVETEVVNRTDRDDRVTVVSRVLDADGKEVSQATSEQRVAAGASAAFTDWQQVPEPKLWSPDSPALYTLVTEVKIGGKLHDEVRTPFGVRTFRFDADEGFFLNGVNTKLKGLCTHHDAGVVGAAVPEGVLRRRLEIVKAIGANAVRCSHNPMAPEFYRLCDELGLLVMDEAFDEWELGKRKWVKGRNVGQAKRFGYAEWFEEWGERDAADMVRAHRNHPSIILWSIGNEIDYPTDPYVHPESRTDPDFAGFSMKGKPAASRLVHVAPKLLAAVKRHDPTRPVTMALANVPAANGTGLAAMLDVAGYNYQEQFYEENHRLFPGRVMVGSENGWWGGRSWRVVEENEYISGLFYWVGFDFLGEAGEWPNHGSQSGLFDTRGELKPAAYSVLADWSNEPVVRLVSMTPPEPENDEGERRRRWGRPERSWNHEQPGTERWVLAYSNAPAVELWLNGRSLGVEKVDRRWGFVRWSVPFEPGELTAVTVEEDRGPAEDRLRTAGDAARLEGEFIENKPLAAGGAGHVWLRVVDADGVGVPKFEEPITVEVTGGGRLLGVDNGDMNDPTPLASPERVARDGKLLVIVQADRESPAPMTVRAMAPGLPPMTLEITAGG